MERERRAYARGAYEQQTTSGNWTRQGLEIRAARLYPTPKVTRPRVVRDPELTIYGPASGQCGELYWSVRERGIIPVTASGAYVCQWEEDQRRDSYPTPRRVKLWADLLASPTETVEDDGSEVSP